MEKKDEATEVLLLSHQVQPKQDGIVQVKVEAEDGYLRDEQRIGVSAWFGGIGVVKEGSAEVSLSRVGYVTAQVAE